MNWSRGRQPAHPRIGPVRTHQPIEHMPRHVLQHGVKYAILMPHGGCCKRGKAMVCDPFSLQQDCLAACEVDVD